MYKNGYSKVSFFSTLYYKKEKDGQKNKKRSKTIQKRKPQWNYQTWHAIDNTSRILYFDGDKFTRTTKYN